MFIEQKNDETKKYYFMAMEKGDDTAMFNLGYYYHTIEHNYDKTKKYYLMAIQKGKSHAIIHLGDYYENVEKNYDEAKKYYLMAMEKGHAMAIKYLKEITTPLERYVIYKKHNISFNETKNNDIQIYINKLKNCIRIDTCPVCYENEKECIILNCFGHYVCSNCYIKIYTQKCPVCRI